MRGEYKKGHSFAGLCVERDGDERRRRGRGRRKRREVY